MSSPVWRGREQLRLRGITQSWVLFSPCYAYRDRLVRVWDPHKPSLAWATLNVGEHRNNPTVRRCIGFAKSWGYGGIDICNLHRLLSTTPQALTRHPGPIGLDDDAGLTALCRHHGLTVLAWGSGACADRASIVAALLWRGCLDHGGSLAVLGWDPTGQPCHPLYVRANTIPECLTSAGGPTPGLHELDSRWSRLLTAATATSA